MSGLAVLYRCTLCGTLREASGPVPCRRGAACGVATGAVEEVEATARAIKAMWRQSHGGTVRALTWAIVGVSLVLLALAGLRTGTE